MTAHQKLTLSSSVAFAFPDLLEFGMEALIDLPPAELARIAERMSKQGFVDKRAKAKDAALHAVLMVPVPLPSGGCFHVRVELFFERVDDERIRLTNRSKMTVNGMQLLRCMLRRDDWPIGLDGHDNVAGPTRGHPAGQVEELLQAIAAAVEQAVEAIKSVMPDSFAVEEEYMWLRKAELAHDLACADPSGTTAAVGQSTFRGAIASMHDVYRQGVSTSDGIPVVRFRLSKSRADLKVYGKTHGLMRHEVSCLTRDAVVTITGRERGEDIGGDTAFDLVQSFMERASPLLMDLLRHVDEIRSELVSPARLIVELPSLVELILGKNSWSADAETAWNSLVLTGVYDAKSKRKGTILRDVLESLTGPDGSLQHGARPTLYHLHPRLVQRARV